MWPPVPTVDCAALSFGCRQIGGERTITNVHGDHRIHAMRDRCGRLDADPIVTKLKAFSAHHGWLSKERLPLSEQELHVHPRNLRNRRPDEPATRCVG